MLVLISWWGHSEVGLLCKVLVQKIGFFGVGGEVRAILGMVRDRGLVVLVEHDADVVPSFARRVAVLTQLFDDSCMVGTSVHCNCIVVITVYHDCETLIYLCYNACYHARSYLP